MQNEIPPLSDGTPRGGSYKIPPLVVALTYNTFLREGIFILKSESNSLSCADPPSAHRPVCMLDTAGKLLEKLLITLLVAAVKTVKICPRCSTGL